MKVLLLNPPPLKIRESHDVPEYPHLGLALLGASLEQHPALRHQFKALQIIDAKLQRLSIERTIQDVVRFEPDVLAVTAMTHEVNTANRICEVCKSILPHCHTIIGGVHVSAEPVETLHRCPGFDFAVIGEGEEVLPELILSLESHTDPTDMELKGVMCRSEGNIIGSAKPNIIAEVNALPSPAFHLFPCCSVYPVMMGRGCPFACSFCMRPYGRKVRFKSMAKVQREITELIDTYHPQRLIFYDETFAVDKARTLSLLKWMSSTGISDKVEWFATTHVNTMSDEVAQAMRAAGCTRVSMGAESGNPEILKATGKGSTLQQVRKAFKAAHRAGLKTEGFFILGHPNETKETISQTIQFATEINPTIPVFGIMVPYPGTRIAHIAKAGEGGYRLMSENWDDYNKQVGSALEFTSISRRRLELFQLWGYCRVFLFNFRFLDFVRFVFRFRREALSFLRNFHFRFKKSSKIQDSVIQKLENH